MRSHRLRWLVLNLLGNVSFMCGIASRDESIVGATLLWFGLALTFVSIAMLARANPAS
ncbi:MAG: hypothetical protein AAGC91_10850 [Pseudomonadota bacterium]